MSDMFEIKTAIRINEDTWIIPEGWKTVKIPETADLMERLKNTCVMHENCDTCPFGNGGNSCGVIYTAPEGWDIDEIRRRLEEAGR